MVRHNDIGVSEHPSDGGHDISDVEKYSARPVEFEVFNKRAPRSPGRQIRGLFIIASLADQWGTRYLAQGKTVWAEQPTVAAQPTPIDLERDACCSGGQPPAPPPTSPPLHLRRARPHAYAPG
jgi:hypothetical protein